MLPILEKASHAYKNIYAADVTQSILLYSSSHEHMILYKMLEAKINDT